MRKTIKSKKLLKKKTIRNKHRKSKKTYGGSPTVVGKIYADWCGHCQMLEPSWNEMKKNLGKKGGAFEFYEIEQKNEETGVNHINEKYLKNSNTKLSLQGGYPTIYKIKNGELSYFNGERNSQELIDWFSK